MAGTTYTCIIMVAILTSWQYPPKQYSGINERTKNFSIISNTRKRNEQK